MRGSSAVVLIVGMFLAAVIGVAAAFGIQFIMPEKKNEAEKKDSTEVVVSAVKDEVSTLDRNIQARLDALMTSVETLSSRVTEIEKKMEESAKWSGVATAPKVAAKEGGKAVQNAPIDEETLEKVIEEVERKRSEERAKRRAQWMAGMQQRFVEAMKGRVEEMGKEKNWDITKEEAVKAILEEQSKKIAELFKGGINEETFAKMREIMEETRTKLSEVLTEEEMNELFRGMRGPFGGRGPRPPFPGGSGSERPPAPPR